MARRLQPLVVGRHRALAGLLWRDTPGATLRDVRAQVRQAAEAYRSRFGVLVEAARTEVGMVPELSQREGRNGTSAAVWLADAQSSPLLYVQDMPNGQYWVVRTEGGYVDPRTDVVCDDEEARTLIDGLLEIQSSDGPQLRVVVNAERKPASLMLDRLPAIEQLEFAALVGRDAPPAKARLRQLVGITPSAVGALIGVAALLGAGWVGYVLYQKAAAQREFEAQRAAMIAQQAEAAKIKNERELRMAQAVAKAAKEDTATPPPDSVILGCAKRLDAIGASVGGWRIVSADCRVDGTGLAIQVMAPRGEGLGTAQTLEHAATEKGLSVSIQPSSQSAAIDASLTPPAPRDGLLPGDMPHARETVVGVLTRFQLFGMAVPLAYTLGAPAPRPVTYLDPEKSDDDPHRFQPVPADKTYSRGTLQVAGTGRWTFGAASYDYPFVTLTKITVIPSAQGYHWQLEATYVTKG